MRSIFSGTVTFRPASSTTCLVSAAFSDFEEGAEVCGEHATAATNAHKSSAIEADLSLKFEESVSKKSRRSMRFARRRQAIDGTENGLETRAA